MKALKALYILGDLCSSQRGLFTSAQAQAAGVGKMTISRLAKYGQIEQVSRGVYRAAGAPSSREEDVYAAWLALDPAVPAWERRLDGSGCVASLNTAAWLYGLGELKPEPITFSCPGRKRSRNSQLRFLTRMLSREDIVFISGMPATTPSRTILDLIDYGEDLSLVSSVLADAERLGLVTEMRPEIDVRSESRGFKKEISLYDYLKERHHE